MLTYNQAKHFLEQTAFKYGSSFGLDGIRSLLNLIDNPQKKLKFIHVGGTNGKGSVCNFLTNILTTGGLKVGTYTSPAVFCELEKFKVCGQNISKAQYAEYVNFFKNLLAQNDNMKFTAFEIETAMAFKLFADTECELCVVECGLGGKDDATNIIENPILSILTSISLDHTNILGNSLSEIAKNKSYIIKNNSTCITTQDNKEVLDILQDRANSVNSKIFVTDFALFETYEIKNAIINSNKNAYSPKPCGDYQKINIPIALEAIFQLNNMGYEITSHAISEGIANTHNKGRFEIIKNEGNITFIIDGAHNESASINLANSINNLKKDKKIILLCGVFSDKDYRAVVKNTAPLGDLIITFDWENSRALSGKILKQEFEKHNKNVCHISDLKKATEYALAQAEDKPSLVVAFGSLSHLAKFKEIVCNEKYD